MCVGQLSHPQVPVPVSKCEGSLLNSSRPFLCGWAGGLPVLQRWRRRAQRLTLGPGWDPECVLAATPEVPLGQSSLWRFLGAWLTQPSCCVSRLLSFLSGSTLDVTIKASLALPQTRSGQVSLTLLNCQPVFTRIHKQAG